MRRPRLGCASAAGAGFRLSGFDLLLSGLTGLIYGLDLLLPSGEAVIILLIFVIVLAGRTQNRARLVVWTGICMALTIGGYFVRHGLIFNPDYTARRAACIFAFLAAVAVLLRNQSLARTRGERALLLEGAAAAIFTRDATGRILSWSKGAEALYGWPEGLALGRNSHALLREEDAPPRAEASTALAATGCWRGEIHRRTAAGAPVIILCDCVLQARGRGDPPIILESGTDVTQYKALQAQLRESETHVRSIFEMASVAIWEEDLSLLAADFAAQRARIGDYEAYFSAHAEHAAQCMARVGLGRYNQEAALLMNGGALPLATGTLLRFCPAKVGVSYLAAALSGSPSFQAETSFLAPGGAQRHVLISAKFSSAKFSRRDALPGQALLSAVDITMQKQAEDDLAALTARLGQMNRNATLGELASMVRGHVENPLAVIAGNSAAAAALLRADDGAEAQVSALMRQVIQEAKAASGSIARIREFLRRGQPGPQGRPAGALLQAVAALLERDFSANLVSLRLELEPNLPEIPRGGFWLEHVVLYILLAFLRDLANADARNRRLRLSAETVSGGVVLEFQPGFHQARQREKVDGLAHLGEGFCLCRAAVEAHGGHIVAWAHGGRLTSLTVSFPV